MTENEAIRVLKNGWNFAILLEDKQLIDIAIQALEEIQQYRSIGTVEECELAINEAIDKHNLMIVYKDSLKDYEAIGTIEDFKALKEKSVAKKVVYKDHTNCCPACDYHYDRSGREWIGKNCPNCGQEILRT